MGVGVYIIGITRKERHFLVVKKKEREGNNKITLWPKNCMYVNNEKIGK